MLKDLSKQIRKTEDHTALICMKLLYKPILEGGKNNLENEIFLGKNKMK